MKKRKMISVILVIVIILIGAIIFIVQPFGPKEPPKIRVTISGRELNYSVGKNEWNGSKYDRLDVVQQVMTMSSGPENIKVSEGETINIEFLGKAPKSYTLTAEIIEDSGELTHKESRKNVPINFKSKKGTFTFSDFGLDHFEDGKLIGFRLLCEWGRNNCEYGVVVQIDK